VWLSNLFKKEPALSSLSWLATDMHSHLIPGIDDGAPDMMISIELIKGFASLGYKKIITTPHILWEMYPNTPEIITKGLSDVRAELAAQQIDIELAAAAEYFIDEHFVQLLAQKAPLLTVKDKMVLVEISTITAPFDFKEVLFEMQMQGYQPIIAHPERYIYLKNSKSVFEDLVDAGCILQLNLLSVTGHYGIAVQELAEYLIKKEYYGLAGTDLHHTKHLSLLHKVATSPLLKRLRESGQIKNHLL
jgi:tyrosine-protein phosphatase YwqE